MSYLNEDDDDEPESLGTGRQDEEPGRRDGVQRRDGDQRGIGIRGTGVNTGG